MSAMLNDNPHILIEMTGKPDCRFIGAWLLKAAEAQSFWSQALRDPAFEAASSALCTWCQPNLECAALETVTALRQQDPPFHGYTMHFVLAVELGFGESGVFGTELAVMVQLGFFVLAGRSYRMTVPDSVTLEGVQRAVLKVASTADQDIYPERLLHTLPQEEAEAWRSWLIQKRLFDAGDLGEMRSICGARLSLSRAGFRILERPLFVIA
jgi:hypothetical protein